MTTSGSVSDYEDTTSLQIAIATLAGIDASVWPHVLDPSFSPSSALTMWP